MQRVLSSILILVVWGISLFSGSSASAYETAASARTKVRKQSIDQFVSAYRASRSLSDLVYKLRPRLPVNEYEFLQSAAVSLKGAGLAKLERRGDFELLFSEKGKLVRYVASPTEPGQFTINNKQLKFTVTMSAEEKLNAVLEAMDLDKRSAALSLLLPAAQALNWKAITGGITSSAAVAMGAMGVTSTLESTSGMVANACKELRDAHIKCSVAESSLRIAARKWEINKQRATRKFEGNSRRVAKARLKDEDVDDPDGYQSYAVEEGNFLDMQRMSIEAMGEVMKATTDATGIGHKTARSGIVFCEGVDIVTNANNCFESIHGLATSLGMDLSSFSGNGVAPSSVKAKRNAAPQ